MPHDEYFLNCYQCERWVKVTSNDFSIFQCKGEKEKYFVCKSIHKHGCAEYLTQYEIVTEELLSNVARMTEVDQEVEARQCYIYLLDKLPAKDCYVNTTKGELRYNVEQIRIADLYERLLKTWSCLKPEFKTCDYKIPELFKVTPESFISVLREVDCRVFWLRVDHWRARAYGQSGESEESDASSSSSSSCFVPVKKSRPSLTEKSILKNEIQILKEEKRDLNHRLVIAERALQRARSEVGELRQKLRRARRALEGQLLCFVFANASLRMAASDSGSCSSRSCCWRVNFCHWVARRHSGAAMTSMAAGQGAKCMDAFRPSVYARGSSGPSLLKVQ